jgi:general secretion pathway protein F
MAVYEYKALDTSGRSKTGVIDADTPREAREKLRKQDVFVTDMTSVAEKKQKAWEKALKVPRIRRSYSYEIAILTRQFATLTSSGVPLSEALGALIEQIDRRALQAVFRDIREKVTQGVSLADALSFHSHYFSNLYVNMVRAGEASGNLDQILSRLADYLQKQHRLRGRVVAALTYPIIMIFLGVGVTLFLMMYLVPKVTTILRRKGNVLPLITELVKGASDLTVQYWWAMFLCVLALYILYRLAVATTSGRYRRDSIMLSLPIVGSFFGKQAISRFCMTMSILLRSGLPALQALSIVREVVGNAVLAEAIQDVHDRVLEGADISTPLRSKKKIFPPVVGYMVSVGEKSGELEEMLEKVAEAYDDELEIQAQKLTSLVEPLIIIFLAAVVGVIVLSVILPIVQMSQI